MRGFKGLRARFDTLPRLSAQPSRAEQASKILMMIKGGGGGIGGEKRDDTRGGGVSRKEMR